MNGMYAAQALGLQNLVGFFRTGNGFGSFS